MQQKNEGFSVYLKKDGQWCARVKSDAGKWLDRRVPASAGIATPPPGTPEHDRAKKKAERWVKANLARLKAGESSIAKVPAAEGILVRDLIEPYLEIRKRSDVRPATLHQDKTTLEGHATRHLGHLAPKDLDTAVLLRFVDELKKSLAPSTVRNVVFTLRTFLDVVKVRKLAPIDANPTRDPEFVKHGGLPKLPKRKKPVLPKEAVEALATHPQIEEAWRLRYLFAATSGLRDGELAGLTWADVELAAKIPVFHVTKAAAIRGSDKKKKAEIGPTKNAGSVAENVPLHPEAAKALKGWKASGWCKYVGRHPRAIDPVFPDRKGNTWRPRSAHQLRSDLETAGQPTDVGGKKLDFHSTRRFFATALARAGVESEMRKLLMRHSTGDVTEESYTERDVEQKYEAVCKIALDLSKAEVVALPMKVVASAS